MKNILLTVLIVLALATFIDVNAQQWNMSEDYSMTNNPTGAWSYGRKWSPQATSFDLFDKLWSPGWWWLGNWGHGAPAVMRWATLPGFWAKNNTNGLPVIRWTCPVSGIYSLSGKFNGVDTRGVDNHVYITLNDSIIFTDHLHYYLDSTNFSFSNFEISKDSKIDFMVDWAGGVYSEYGVVEANAIFTTPGISPDHGGNNGKVTVEVTGNGFMPGAQVKLTRDGQSDIFADSSGTQFISPIKIRTTFSFIEAAIGPWDLVITNPDSTTIVFDDGFVLESVIEFPYINLIGPNQLRAGQPTQFIVRCENAGNINSTSGWLMLWIPNGCGFTLNYSGEQLASCEMSNNYNSKWKLLPLFVPNLPVNSSMNFDLTIKAPPGMQSGTFGIDFTNDIDDIIPSCFQWENSNNKENNISSNVVENEKGAQGDVIFVTATYVGGQTPPSPVIYHLLLDLGNGMVGHHFFGSNSTNSEFPYSQIENGYVHSGYKFEITHTFSPPVGVNQSNIIANWNEFKNQNFGYSSNPSNPSEKSCLSAIMSSWYGLGNNYPSEMDIDNKNGLSSSELLKYLSDRDPNIFFGNNFFLLGIIPEMILGNLYDFILSFTVINSWDPNDKFGPLGFSESHYILPNEPMYYIINFENVDSATASAEVITIVDTLSQNLDWNSFCFDTTSHVVTNRTIDKSNGIIKWEFVNINLPPNITPPEGEGWVMYHVNQKPDLPSGAQINNRASIKFDYNEPMITPTVFNTIDAGPPTSQMNLTTTYIGDTTYLISWSGQDDDQGAGIRDFTIYFSESPTNGYQPLIMNTTEINIPFKGAFGKIYYFYSIARDGVGHLEAPPPTYDLSLETSPIFCDHTMAIPQNWSAISSYVIPQNPDLDVVFSEIDEKIVIMISRAGLYWPSQNLNTIGNWDPWLGYKIKMNEAAALCMNGDFVENKMVNLLQGGNYLPILSDNPIIATSIFDQIEDKLIYAFDFDGYVYWPGGGLYTLQLLEPGKAYFLSLSAPATVTFPGSKGSENLNNKKIQMIENSPWTVTKTGSQHIISIFNSALDDLKSGDIIAAFNLRGLCVGQTQFNGDAENLPLIIYGDDLTTSNNDGMMENEAMTFKGYNASTKAIIDIYPMWDMTMSNSDIFTENGLSAITSLTHLAAFTTKTYKKQPKTRYFHLETG
jgi:hypothetical protein